MVTPQRCPWGSGAIRVAASVTRWLLSPGPDHSRLAGGGEQRAVLGPDVGQAVAEAVDNGVDADVDQHPLGRDQLRHPDGVVEAVAAGPHAEGLADAKR